MLLPHSPWQVFLITPLLSTQTSTLMMLVTPSQVSLLVSIVYTSILILQTLLQTSTTLSVTKVLHLTTQVCSIAHTFLSRWFVPSVRTPSSLRSASRLVMVLLLTHSQKVLLLSPTLVVSRQMQTVTIRELSSRTSCDPRFTYFTQRVFGPSFFI